MPTLATPYHPPAATNAYRLGRMLQLAFAQQAAEMARSISPSILDNDDEAPDLNHWPDHLAAMLRPTMLQLFQQGIVESRRRIAAISGINPSYAYQPAQRIIPHRRHTFGVAQKQLGVSFDLFDPRVIRAVDAATMLFCEETNDTATTDLTEAIRKLRKLLKQGLEKGKAIAQLAREVKRIFADPARAFRIATTETSRAIHGGALYNAMESSLRLKKEWLSSQDACFVAGSLVLKFVGPEIKPIGIETLKIGDEIVSGSGKRRRVVGVGKKWYDGDLVCGLGFAATPDHRFLTVAGWRPIGDYAFEAGSGFSFDFLSEQPQDVPPALLQITGLSFIFGRDLRFTMPVFPITKNNQFPIIDDEINYPTMVHGDLFSEIDFCFSEKEGCFDFNVSSFAANSPQERYDGSAPFHETPVSYGSTGSRTKRSMPFFRIIPTGQELFAAGSASNSFFDSNSGIGLKGQVLALTATEFSSSFDGPVESPVRPTTELTSDELRFAAMPFPHGSESFGDNFGSSSFVHEDIVPYLYKQTNPFSGFVYDIEVEEDHSFTLACGLIAHNCDACLELMDKGAIELDEPFRVDGTGPYAKIMTPPGHPHCLLPETPVIAPDSVSAIKAFFAGTCYRITFANGDEISCTPNHMLLSRHGFICASDLVEGDDILHCPVGKGPRMVDPNDYGNPVPIEQVFNSAAVSGGLPSPSVMTAPEYLHGDAAFCEGKIDVVNTNSFLWDDLSFRLGGEPIKESFFKDGEFSFAFDRGCVNDLGRFLHRLASFCSVGRSRHAGAKLFAENRIGISVGAGSYSSSLESLEDGVTGASVGLRESRGGLLSGGIGFDDFVNNGPSEFASVSHVEPFPYEGFVYDLTTQSSLYLISNGIVSSNCFCTFTEVLA